MKKCIGCREEKPLDCFGRKSNAKDGKQSKCFICQRTAVKEHYNANKQYYIDKATKHNKKTLELNREFIKTHLENNSCVDCGESDIRCLQFDHVRGEKLNNISDLVRRFSGLDTLKSEIDKCEVRCANCHMKRTSEQFNWWTHTSVHPLATNESKG